MVGNCPEKRVAARDRATGEIWAVISFKPGFSTPTSTAASSALRLGVNLLFLTAGGTAVLRTTLAYLFAATGSSARCLKPITTATSIAVCNCLNACDQ